MNISTSHRTRRRRAFGGFALGIFLIGSLPASARASIFQGETLDSVADVLSWVVLLLAPVIGLIVFLAIHILPEKIAERRRHPQAKAIQCLCLLSLVFGGLLWPLAWLWAYSKPVFHKLAYGTDEAEPEQEAAAPPPGGDESEELRRLYQRVGELESKLARKSAREERKV